MYINVKKTFEILRSEITFLMDLYAYKSIVSKLIFKAYHKSFFLWNVFLTFNFEVCPFIDVPSSNSISAYVLVI